jgi:hypothetical protein
MAGEPVPFLEEVRSYFQVDLTLGDPAAYAAAHAELDGLLPGSGSLSDRYAAHRRREECPPERLAEAVHVLSSALRDRVRAEYGLPEVETVRYEVVTDKPWSGFNYYEGDYRSRVAINADLPHRLGQLPHLVAHEAYPGHHTEHCRKERGWSSAAPGPSTPSSWSTRPSASWPRGWPTSACRPRSATAGVRGRPRCSATSGCASTGTSPSGSRRPPRR